MLPDYKSSRTEATLWVFAVIQFGLSFLDNSLEASIKKSIPDNTNSWIIMEYQGYRMILKYQDSKMYFYPYADVEEDWDFWKLNKKRCIEFKGLTLSAIAGYLKQIPAIKDKELNVHSLNS